MQTFNTWLDTFLEEKGIDLEDTFDVGDNIGMDYEVVVSQMKRACAEEQKQLKNKLVEIDFRNGDVKHFLRHLAQALVIKI